MTADPLNWPAIGAGTLLAFALGMVWFSPALFGRAWSQGSHDLKPPARLPYMAMLVLFVGLLLLALVVGLTARTDALGTALAAIAAVSALIAGMDLFSQKSPGATAIDAGYLLACGALMIGAQAAL